MMWIIIITIQEAIAADSIYLCVRKVKKGEFSSAYKSSPHQLEGEIRVGGQHHFYLEPQGCLVVPKEERGEMEIFASTQYPGGVQEMVAKALGVSENKITIRVK